MPASPWKALQPAVPSREYLVLLSFLPLKRLWRIPWFVRQASRITQQPALQAFVHEAPHADTMRMMIPHMGQTRFVRWTVRGADLPVRWDEALRR